MKVLIIYDSQFGNTERISQAIAESITQAQLLQVSDAGLEDLKGINLLIIGSPTHGGRATPTLTKFLSQIPTNMLKNIKVVAFDTRFSEKDLNFPLKLLIRAFGYAAPKIAESLQNKGGDLIISPEGFIVKGKEGPLFMGELERAKNWAKTIIRL